MLSLEDLESYYPVNLRSFKKNILREYLQFKILEIIFDSSIGAKISFIGGTALRIVYNTQRFSEDLDFDNFNLSKEEFEKVAAEVKQKLQLEGYKVDIQTVTEKKTFHCKIRVPDLLFENRLSAHANEKILIKVDTEPQGFKYNPDKKILNKFDITTHINVTPADILLSQKISAVFKRKRTQGRDLYDMVFLSSLTKPNYEFLDLKLNIKSKEKLKEKLLTKCKELDLNKLAKDVEPLVFASKDVKKIILFNDFIKEVDF